MAFQPVPGHAIVAVLQRLHGQEVVNTLAFEGPTGSASEAELLTLATAVFNAWVPYIMPHLSENLTVVGARAYGLSTSSSPVATYVSPSPVPGSIGQPALPGNVAFCIKFLTGGRGRTTRGRNFIAGLAEGAVTGNSFVQIGADSIVAGFNQAATAIELTSWQHVVLSRFVDKVKRPTGTSRPVTAYAYTDLFVDSQRRRLTGRGV